MLATKKFSFFERFLKIFFPDAAELHFYKRQCETYENIIVPQTSREARDTILRMREDKRELLSALEEASEHCNELRKRNFELVEETAVLRQKLAERG